MKTSLRIYQILLIFIVFYSCKNEKIESRGSIDLAGVWQFDLDSENEGIDQEWFSRDLGDKIELPGTMEVNSKGFKNEEKSTLRLSRSFIYTGPAWYRKEVNIPEGWEGKLIDLCLERTKSTMVWVDDNFIGNSLILESKQIYDLSKFLTPGKHFITVRVDNSLSKTPYGNVHIYSDDTQTNWNGILGMISLNAKSRTNISRLKVESDIHAKKINVRMYINNPTNEKCIVKLSLTKRRGGLHVNLSPESFVVECDSVINIDYLLSGNAHLWDEYNRTVYDIDVQLLNKDKSFIDCQSTVFGMRKFDTKGSSFTINDRVTFLRGKNDACVFPLTGHVPMDVQSWTNVMSIAKEYGINHYRFHSWCPPEAAFIAADNLGIYLQVELPFWGGLENDTIKKQLFDEGVKLLDSYGNHPSFVMFSMGNEIWGNLERVAVLMNDLKRHDNRPLYTHGSNVNIGYSYPLDGSQFFVAARTPSNGDNHLAHTRLTHAFADSKDGGLLNSMSPNSAFTFKYPVSQINMPILSHEIGQYQIYPDFKEIEKYTGVLKAENLKIFKSGLIKSGMEDLNEDFQKASGALSAICYRAEIEAALRTNGMGGFQLLDLQDFPGQGTALVGILDAFMESKKVITKNEWTNFCNDVVPLLVFDRYCYKNSEKFSAVVNVANYSNKNITNKVSWVLFDDNGSEVQTGSLKRKPINLGGLNNVGSVNIDLKKFTKATKLELQVSIDSTEYKNTYPIWVYPKKDSILHDKSVVVSTVLNKALLLHLESGGKAFLLPNLASVYSNSFPGMFIPDFWNFTMFKNISISNGKPVSPGTMGLLINKDHPVFSGFPTEFHSNWQWWNIVKKSNSLILDNIGKDFKPIVQVIDNMERNHKLGLLFEVKVGKGKLMVCTSRLNENLDKPEVRRLYNSVLSYIKSDSFKPEKSIDEEKLKQLIRYTVTKF